MNLSDKNVLTVAVEDICGGHIVAVDGECDTSTAPILKDVLRSLIFPSPSAPTRLIVDLRGLTYMDSSAFWVLAAANRKVHGVGGGLALVVDERQPISCVIKLLKMDRLIGVYATPDEALSGLNQGLAGNVGAKSEDHAS